jgi:tetratricopeptide (TPR) repeat protein
MPDDLRVPHYPRPRAFRMVRWIFRRSFLALLAYPAAGLYNLGQTIATQGLPVLFDGSNWLQAFYLNLLGPYLAEHPLLLVPASLILLLFLGVGFLAHQDFKREQEALKDQKEHASLNAKLPSLLQRHLPGVLEGIGIALPPPPAPPFDLDKLLAPPRLVDRDSAREWLLGRLRVRADGATFAVEGLGGVGKSSFVADILKVVKQEGLFPAGIAVVLCNQRTDGIAVLRDALRRFVRNQGSLETLDEQGLTDLATATFSGKHALVVLDNVEPDMPLGNVTMPLQAAGAMVVVTANFRVPRELIPETNTIEIDVLDEAGAIELFKERYDGSFTAEDETAIREIVRETARHTLAIVLAADYAADARVPLPDVALQLKESGHVLDLKEGTVLRSDRPIRGVRLTFQHSFDMLPLEAQRAFLSLAVMPTTDFTRAAAVAVAEGSGATPARAGVDMLVRRSLLASHPALGTSERDRLRLHPLLQSFAKERADATLCQSAGQAMTRYYLGYVTEHARDPAAIDGDYANITGGYVWAYEQRAEPGMVEMAADYLGILHNFFYDRGHWQDGLRYLAWGAEICAQANQPELGVRVLLDLAHLTRNSGQYETRDRQFDEAEQEILQALTVARTNGYRSLEAMALHRLGDLAHARHRLEEALDYFDQARRLSAELGDRTAETHELNSMGHVLADLYRFAEARSLVERALAQAEMAGATNMVAYANLLLGKIARREGRLREAMEYEITALERYSQIGELGSVGGALEEIGLVEEAEGHRELAISHWKEAIRIYTNLGTPRAEHVQQNLIDHTPETRPVPQ